MPTIVQTGSLTGSYTGNPFSSPVTAGNALVYFANEVLLSPPGWVSMSDNLNGASSFKAGCNSNAFAVYLTPVSAGGTLTVTGVDNSGLGVSTLIVAVEISGAGAFDGADSTLLSGFTPPPSGTIIPNTAIGGICVAFALDTNGNTINAGTGWTDLGVPPLSSNGTRLENIAVTTLGMTGVFSSSLNFDTVIISSIILDAGASNGSATIAWTIA